MRVDGRVGVAARLCVDELVGLAGRCSDGVNAIRLVDLLARARLSADAEVLLVRGRGGTSVAVPAGPLFVNPTSGGVLVIQSDDPDDVIADVVEADDAEVRTFDGDFSGSLRAVFSDQVDALIVQGDGLAPLGAGLTLQLWLVDDSGAQSVGLFRPDDRGRVETAFDGTDPEGFALGVTIDPAGGSDVPTEPIVAVA